MPAFRPPACLPARPSSCLPLARPCGRPSVWSPARSPPLSPRLSEWQFLAQKLDLRLILGFKIFRKANLFKNGPKILMLYKTREPLKGAELGIHELHFPILFFCLYWNYVLLLLLETLYGRSFFVRKVMIFWIFLFEKVWFSGFSYLCTSAGPLLFCYNCLYLWVSGRGRVGKQAEVLSGICDLFAFFESVAFLFSWLYHVVIRLRFGRVFFEYDLVSPYWRNTSLDLLSSSRHWPSIGYCITVMVSWSCHLLVALFPFVVTPVLFVVILALFSHGVVPTLPWK